MMTRMEKTVRIVSELYDFYRQIPKISDQRVVRGKKPNQDDPSVRAGTSALS
jgi:hypothetical protein